MEDYIISQDLLKEMQQDGLIDPITDDMEPKPQPLPSNTILSDTKKMINNQINNKKLINNNKTSLIPEVSESQENAESISFNYNSLSKGLFNKNERQLLNSRDKKLINENYIKEEENIEDKINNLDNNINKSNNDELKEIDNEDNNEKNDENENNSQSSFTSFGRPKTEFVNTSISTEGIEPLYFKTNNNIFNGNLTPLNQSKIQSNFIKNNNDINNINKVKYLNDINNDKVISKKIKGKNIKEIKKLQNELNSLTKQFEKIYKSLKNKSEELKKIKLINENLLKDNNNQKKIIDSLNNEKVLLNSKIISLKDYCNKMETKLISGSKNQHIIEINNKLRQENESLNNEIHYNEIEKKDLIKQNNILNDEINFLKKEFQSSLQNCNNHNNNNSNNSNNEISKILSELFQQKKKLKTYEEEILNLKNDKKQNNIILQKKEEEIQSLNYGKTQMTTIIAHKENEIHNLTIERDSFQQHFQECNNQLRTLKDKIKDYEIKKKDKNEYEQANSSFYNKQEVKTQKLLEQYESVIKKYINEINLLKKENKELNIKLSEYEIEKNNKIKEYNMVIKDKNKYNDLFNKLVDKLNEDVKIHINNNNIEVNNEIYSKIDYEKVKNMKLISQIEGKIN